MLGGKEELRCRDFQLTFPLGHTDFATRGAKLSKDSFLCPSTMFDALAAELLEERSAGTTRPTASASYTGAVTDWAKIVSSINDGAAEKLSGISKCSTVMLERGTYGTVSAFFGTWQRTLSAWASDPARAVELTIVAATDPGELPLTVRSAAGGDVVVSAAACSFNEKHAPLESLYWPANGAIAQSGPAARWQRAVHAAHEAVKEAPQLAMAESARLVQMLAGLRREGAGLPLARPADKRAFFHRYEAAQPQRPDRVSHGGGNSGVAAGSTTCVDSARSFLAAKSVPMSNESARFLHDLVRTNAANLVNWQQSAPHRPPPTPVNDRLQTTAAAHAAQRIVRGLDEADAAAAAAADLDTTTIPYAHDALRAPGNGFPSLRLAVEQKILRERLPVAQFIALAARAGIEADHVHQRRAPAPPLPAASPAAPPVPAPAVRAASAAAPKPAAPRLPSLGRLGGGPLPRTAPVLAARKKPTPAPSAAADAAGPDDRSPAAAGDADAEREHSEAAARKRPSTASKRAEPAREQEQVKTGSTSSRPVRKTAGINNSSSTKDFLSLP